ncbi:MAG: hypothetical protein CFE44_25545, partial [Burkholderiales bacterium PBB4]
PVGINRAFNPKGFWRIDKEKVPELRQTVLSLVAFNDLSKVGLSAFLSQNRGNGWQIPESLRLTDYGLGHDERAIEHQPVAACLGPRLDDAQTSEEAEGAWKDCCAHAEVIQRIAPSRHSEIDNGASESSAEEFSVANKQGALF